MQHIRIFFGIIYTALLVFAAICYMKNIIHYSKENNGGAINGWLAAFVLNLALLVNSIFNLVLLII